MTGLYTQSISSLSNNCQRETLYCSQLNQASFLRPLSSRQLRVRTENKTSAGDHQTQFILPPRADTVRFHHQTSGRLPSPGQACLVLTKPLALIVGNLDLSILQISPYQVFIEGMEIFEIWFFLGTFWRSDLQSRFRESNLAWQSYSNSWCHFLQLLSQSCWFCSIWQWNFALSPDKKLL